jgi:hypothetical protein
VLGRYGTLAIGNERVQADNPGKTSFIVLNRVCSTVDTCSFIPREQMLRTGIEQCKRSIGAVRLLRQIVPNRDDRADNVVVIDEEPSDVVYGR